MTNQLMVRESPVAQRDGESIIYTLDTKPWGGEPSDVSITIFDITGDNADVTDDVMPVNDPQVEGDVITFSPLELLVKDHDYLLVPKFTSNGSVLTPPCVVHCIGTI